VDCIYFISFPRCVAWPSSLGPVVQNIASLHKISGQVLSSHSNVSLSRTVRPCSGSVDWTLEDNMVDDLFFSATLTGRRGGHAPFLQAGAETPDTSAEAVEPDPGSSWAVIPGMCVPVSWMKVGKLAKLSKNSALHWWSTARMLLLSDELMSCCAAGTNGCLDLQRRAFPLGGQASGESSRCPGSMARRDRGRVAPLRRSSSGWMSGRTGRLSVGVGRRHPVTNGKASLMAGSIGRVWEHQRGAQYYAVQWTRARVAIHSVDAPAPQPEPASRLRSVMRDVSFLQVTQGVGDTWATFQTLLRGIWVRSRRAGFCCWGWLSTHV